MRKGRAEMRRTCFMHIGTHKTGSTSLQYFLWENRSVLEMCGLTLPKTLWLSGAPGHHIIPAATGVGSIDPQLGTLDDLMAEIAAANTDVLLSTESYWTILPWAAGMRDLQAKIEDAGCRVEYVVYLRDQSQVLASWYSEIAKIGNVEGFDGYVAQIIESGTWISRSGAKSDFEYDRFLSCFQAVTERPIHVRSFHEVASGSLMQRDFLKICCPDTEWPDGFFDAATWTNHRLGAHATQALVQLNRLSQDGLPRERVEAEVMRRATERDRNRTFDPYRLEQLAVVKTRFSDSNRRLSKQFGISFDDAPVPGGLTWRAIAGPEEFRSAAMFALQDVATLLIVGPDQLEAQASSGLAS